MLNKKHQVVVNLSDCLNFLWRQTHIVGDQIKYVKLQSNIYLAYLWLKSLVKLIEMLPLTVLLQLKSTRRCRPRKSTWSVWLRITWWEVRTNWSTCGAATMARGFSSFVAFKKTQRKLIKLMHSMTFSRRSQTFTLFTAWLHQCFVVMLTDDVFPGRKQCSSSLSRCLLRFSNGNLKHIALKSRRRNSMSVSS